MTRRRASLFFLDIDSCGEFIPFNPYQDVDSNRTITAWPLIGEAGSNQELLLDD
jgi:hypothetical protein